MSAFTTKKLIDMYKKYSKKKKKKPVIISTEVLCVDSQGYKIIEDSFVFNAPKSEKYLVEE